MGRTPGRSVAEGLVDQRARIVLERVEGEAGGLAIGHGDLVDLVAADDLVGDQPVVRVDLEGPVGPGQLPVDAPSAIVPPRPSRPSKVPPSKVTTRRPPSG